jgi:hypothetical protein
MPKRRGSTMATYKERYLNERRKSTLKRVEEINQLVKNLFPKITKKGTRMILSKCAHYHYDKKRKISTEELMLYDVLIKHNLNPSRVYKWYLVSLLPEDIKDDVEKNKYA